MQTDSKGYNIYRPKELLGLLRANNYKLNPHDFKKIGIVGFDKIFMSKRRLTLLDQICQLLHQKLPGVTEHLYIPSGKLSQLPDSLWSLDRLVGLDVRDNNIKDISSKISQLKRLKYLIVLVNPLEQLPDSIGGLKRLTMLSAIECPLKYLPASVGQLSKLTTLELYFTKLDDLPWQLKYCPLHQIDVSRDDDVLIKVPSVLAEKFKYRDPALYQQALLQYPQDMHMLIEQRKYYLTGIIHTMAQADNKSLFSRVFESIHLRRIIFSNIVDKSPDEALLPTAQLSEGMVESYYKIKERRNQRLTKRTHQNYSHLFFSPLSYQHSNPLQLSEQFNLVESDKIDKRAVESIVHFNSPLDNVMS